MNAPVPPTPSHDPAGDAIAHAPPTPIEKPPAGQKLSASRYSWGLLIVFSVFGLVCLIGTMLLIYVGVLKDHDAARNVITIVFTVGTISLAIILVLAVLLLEDETAIARFQRGKEVLTILVGILGTIVGFYFGANSVERATNVQSPNADVRTTAIEGSE